MITITECRPPRKLSGTSSFLVKFEYNPAIVDILKSFIPAVWHKADLAWEISSNYLSKLLDALTFIDDINLTLLSNETQGISTTDLTENEIGEFRCKPYAHQVEAVNFGLKHHKWLLLDSMGLGKTYEAICLAEALHRRHEIEHCLIICGVDSLRQNWKSEIQAFSNESCIVLGEKINSKGKVGYETLQKRSEQLKNEIQEFFIIVNITNVRDDKFVEAFKKSKNKIDMIVFDEAHHASKSSQQGANLLKLSAKYKVALTGTLLTNSPISAYLPLSWTENDHATLTNYKSQYCNFGGFNNSQVVGYRNLDLLKDELDSCSIRRTFDQVRGDMPLKTIEYEIVEMSDEHRKFYDAIKAGVKEEADKIELKANNLLALTTRLRQATSAPSVLTTNTITSSKIDRAVELAEDILDNGDKLVIFSTFVEPCYELASKLSKYRPLLGTGRQQENEITDSIDKFRNSGDFNLLCATMSKLGTGFSFPECHYALFIDQPFTDALFAQAHGRIFRVTSQQPVFIKVLVCKDTIDERVKKIVESKRDLSDFVIDDKDNSLAQELRSIIGDL